MRRKSSIGLLNLLFLFVGSSTVAVNYPNGSEQDATLVVAGRFSASPSSIYSGYEEWKTPIFASLFTRNTITMEWIPDLASSDLELLADGSYRVRLKPDLKFSNGNPLTAQDVVFTYTTYTDLDLWNAFQWIMSDYFDLESFVLEDDLTIRFKPYSKLHNPHAILSYPIVDQDFYQSLYDACKLSPTVEEKCNWKGFQGLEYMTGAGPYKLVETDNCINNEVNLFYDKNPFYWNTNDEMAEHLIFIGRFYNEILYQEFSNGDIDILLSSNDNIHNVELGGIKLTFPTPSAMVLYPNHQHPYVGTGVSIPKFVDKSVEEQRNSAVWVRKAIAHMVNPDVLDYVNETAWSGQVIPTSSPFGVATRGWTDSFPVREYNILLAKSYMERAGFNYDDISFNNATGVYETFFFDFNCIDHNGKGSQWYDLFKWTMLEGLRDIGINGTVEALGFREYINRSFNSTGNPPTYENGGYDCMIMSSGGSYEYTPGYRYHEAGLAQNWGEGFPNFTNYLNSTVEHFVDEYLDSGPANDMTDDISQIQKALYDDLPEIPMFSLVETLIYLDELIIPHKNIFRDSLYIKYDQIRSPDWIYLDSSKISKELSADNLVWSSFILSVTYISIVRRKNTEN